jgi:predicted metal-dependent peptidase
MTPTTTPTDTLKARACMTRARTRILLDHPWFGALAMRLQMLPDESQPTCATDGTRLVYNPSFVTSLPDSELTAVMAHEVMHCALLHPYRRGARDAEQWNVATDHAINLQLQAAGFGLPSDCLADPQYAGLSADVIYAKLSAQPKPPPQPQGGSGQPQPGGKPLSTGSVMDAPQPATPDPNGTPSPSSQPMTAEDWKIAAEQATAVSRAAGSTPAGAARAAKLARESAEDWRATLREFIEHTQPSDYSWSSPNRRHLAAGLYLPGIIKENLAVIAVAVDTSGSISQAVLDCFASELTAIVHEARPERVDVLYCDARIQHTESFSPDDPEVKLAAHGGGGTRFAPVLDRLSAECEPPACLIYFTDLENGSERLEEPQYPVLWVTGKQVTKHGPFGRTVRVDLYA